MHVVESLPALVVSDKMYYSCCCAGLNVVNNNNNNNNRIEQQKRSKGLLFFDETFLAHQKTLLIFSRTLISKRALTLLLQKRVVVCLLSLLSFSFIASLRVVQRYIYRETNGQVWNRREKQKRSEFYFFIKALCFRKISSLHRAERNER